jgi:hypothetical protein
VVVESSEVEIVDNAGGTVTAATHDYSLNIRIIEHGLQVGKTLSIVAGEVIFSGAYRVAHYYLKAPAFEDCYSVCDICCGYIACGGCDTYGVS